MKNSIELLAPAGSKDAACAAIEYGADAIYLGLSRFSARAEAINFTTEEFYDTVGYAHACDTKVYVTLNTLVKESEIDSVLSLLQIIEDAAADAIIVQDLGVLRLLQEYFPGIPVHASTQMAIHNREGVEYLKRLGVKRVTLARELSIAEVADISGVSGIETESFLHGALCYSYSGLCMYSSMQSGRSANRGRCAYSCRELFACPDLKLQGHAFSLRDLSLIEHIPALKACGVDSLKIEGRKKSALYVAAVVRLYRGVIDGTASGEEISEYTRDLRTIFSRETTAFFADSEASRIGKSSGIDTSAVGHRGALIGRVEGVSSRGQTSRLSFVTGEDFEKHDGIQVDISGSERPYGFAVNELYVITAGGKNRSVFEVKKGDRVEIALPEDHPVLPAGAPVYLSSSQRVKRELKWSTPKPMAYIRRYPVAIQIELSKSGVKVSGSIVDGRCGEICHETGHQAEDYFSEAKKPDQSRAAAEKVFGKTGSTPFVLNNFEFRDEERVFVPVSLLNKLRREFYEGLAEKLQEDAQRSLAGIQAKVVNSEVEGGPALSSAPEWIVKTDNPISLFGVSSEISRRIAEVIVEINENTNSGLLSEEIQRIGEVFPQAALRIALPSICRNSRMRNVCQIIEYMAGEGVCRWQVSNFWGLQALQGVSVDDVSASSSFYTLNHLSIEEQQSLGLSWSTLEIEDEYANLNRLIARFGNMLCLTVYQDTPLFIGEACSYSSFVGSCPEDCREINQHREWLDNRGNSYFLSKKGCRTFLVNSSAFSLSGYLERFTSSSQRPRYFEADFINRSYTGDDVNRVLLSLFSDSLIADTHTGNFLRTLL